MRSFVVALVTLLAVAASCADQVPPPPIACGADTCSPQQYCAGLVCDDVAQSMGQCTTIGTAYYCVALPSACADDATCGCLMSLEELTGLPGATCVEPRTFTSFVF